MTLQEIQNLGRQRYKTFGIFYHKYLIYKITNLINNKIYIGQTTNLSKRIKSYLYHGTKSDGQQPIHRTIKKHGLDKFFFEIIEETNLALIDEREKFWIDKFNSHIDKNGYNITLGGVKFRWNKENIEKRKASAKNKKPVYLYNKDGSFYAEFHSMNECALFFGVKHCTIWSSIKFKNLFLSQYLITFKFEKKIESYINLKGEKISKQLKNNRNCKTFIWKLEDFKNDKIYEIDGIKKLSEISGYKVDILRSIAYQRNGYTEYKKFLKITKLKKYD